MTKLSPDSRLNQLLKQRVTPMENDDLSARIISASRAVVQRKNVTLAIWLRRIFTEFSLPTPAYALASVLVLGFIIGLGLQDAEITEANMVVSSEYSIFYEESVL